MFTPPSQPFRLGGKQHSLKWLVLCLILDSPRSLLDSKSFMGIIPVARQKHWKYSHEMVQGSLLNGIDKKTCRRKGIEPTKVWFIKIRTIQKWNCEYLRIKLLLRHLVYLILKVLPLEICNMKVEFAKKAIIQSQLQFTYNV